MKGYTVVINSQLEIDNAEDRDDWYRKYTNHFGSISPLQGDERDVYSSKGIMIPDIVSAQDIKLDEACHVVWAEYSMGNSMGRCEGNVEIFAVFKDEKSALTLQKALENAKSFCSFYYDIDGCEIKDMALPWDDYHSRLTEVHISTTVMS